MANRTYHPRGVLVHGFRPQEHPLYATWGNMLARCYNPSDDYYPHYGGRGISVDPKWHHFRNFAEDMGLKPSPELTLERVNNDKNYSKKNCTWATRTEQCWNRRTFKNNKSGCRGVFKLKCGRFRSRFVYEKITYELGRFGSLKEAKVVRDAFIGLFFRDRPAALVMMEVERVRYDSSTKVRGVTAGRDGMFMARVTIKGVREYLGLYKTVELAAAAISERKKHK